MNTVVNPRRKLKLDRSKQNLTDSDLPEIWRKIKAEHIQFVDLSYNKGKIEELVLSADYLQSVRYLYLYQSDIQSIRIKGDLPNLRILHLGGNQLKSFSLPRGFANLQHLRLEENQLEEFELKDFEGLKEMKALYLQENKLEGIPQELWEKEENCWKRVEAFLKDAKKSGMTQNNEVKLILIGNGSVGKTQIALRLTQQEKYVFNEKHDSTHGISLLKRVLPCDFLKEGLALNIWDFGGQDIYHATHRMFMQSKALFVLVWDVRNEYLPHHEYEGRQYKNEQLEYWLSYAACFGENSPVLVLQNKVDTSADKKYLLPPSAQKTHQEKHTHIERFLAVSAKTGYGFKPLEKAIQRIFKEHAHLKRTLEMKQLPNNWVNIRNRVRAEQNPKGKKRIDLKEFRAWCAAEGAEDSATFILEFFHDTGVLFYRPHYFSGQIILDQAWAIKAVYKILDRESDFYADMEQRVNEEKGRLVYADLCEVWADESDEERALFIDFMLSCELCFEWTNRKEEDRTPELKERIFIVPQLLSEQQPAYLQHYAEVYGLNQQKVLQYRFLPAVFMHRFIVQAQHMAEVEDMWQQGVFVEYQGAHALVKADYTQKTIVIQYNENVLGLEKAIEEQLKGIAQEGKVQARRETAELGKIELAEDFLRKEMQQHLAEKGLNRLQKPRAETDTSSQKAARLFLSYAKEDEPFLNQFLNQLSILKRRNIIAPWSEQDILPSEKWAEKSREKLKEADIIVLLVSAAFLANDEKWENDLELAMERHQKGEALVVPILLKDCMWELAPFADLLILPRNGEPISSTDVGKRDAVWRKVTSEIKKLLDKR